MYPLLLALVLNAPAQQCKQVYCDPRTESCCKDQTGSECCVLQSTMCVPPRGGFATTTCCARWQIGCVVGSVGCCDPARPWQFLGAEFESDLLFHAAAGEIPAAPTVAAPPSAATGFALFSKALSSELVTLTIDLASGQTTSRAVTGPATDYYALYSGEDTRVLPFDPAARRFVFADLDFGSGVLTHPLVLYTIDAATGASTSREVRGCSGYSNYPVGQAWDVSTASSSAGGALLVASQTESRVHFCSIHPETAQGTPLGSVARGRDEADPNHYAAYISHAGSGLAYRIGYLQATNGTGGGVGVTPYTSVAGTAAGHGTAGTTNYLRSINGSNSGVGVTFVGGNAADDGSSGKGGTVWHPATASPSHGLPVSMVPHPSGGFLSLAPRSTGLRDRGRLDVLRWSLDASGGAPSAPTLVAELANARHPPLGLLGAGILGYVADTTDGRGLYAALTVSVRGVLGVRDLWTVSRVDLASGGVTEAALNPQPTRLGSETSSLSGFGIASQ